MLMSALAAGRGISLPSLSAAAAAPVARTPPAPMRGSASSSASRSASSRACRSRLGRLAATAYLLDAARRLTCAGLDEGRKLAVISAIMKAHATYRMRDAVDDAMDVHAGKAVIDGPKQLSRQPPPGGARRHHRRGRQHPDPQPDHLRPGRDPLPSLPAGRDAGADRSDEDEALDAFDKAFWAHVGHSADDVLPRLRPRLDRRRASRRRRRCRRGRRGIYRQLSRYAAAFALTADMALLTLGGALKRKEMLSARLGDMLSELYLLSARAQALGGRGSAGGRPAAGRLCVRRRRFADDRRQPRRGAREPAEPARPRGFCAS